VKNSHLFGTILVSCLVTVGPAFAAPAAPSRSGVPATTASTAKPVLPVARPAAAPAAKPVQPVSKPDGTEPVQDPIGVVVEPPSRLPENFQPAVDLKRVAIGNQAGLLKIFHRETGHEAYFRTLDDCNSARFTAEQRQAIFAELGLTSDEVELAARQVMVDYPKLPKRAVLAFLGAIGSDPSLEPALRTLMQRYLAERYAVEKDNILRRQALLSLALMHKVDAQTVEMVTQVFETESNLWLTFPVQMFFQHHAPTIRDLALLEVIRGRAGSVASLYTENVLKSLDEASAMPSAPPSEQAPAAPETPASAETSPVPGPSTSQPVPTPSSPQAPPATEASSPDSDSPVPRVEVSPAAEAPSPIEPASDKPQAGTPAAPPSGGAPH